MLTTEATTLAVDGVGVQFEGVIALEGVSLCLQRGEIVGLIGPNGAGKTTLMNVFSGFQRPRSGRVLLRGGDVTRIGPARLARQGVARTFQGARVFPRLTVLENVTVGALGVGVGPRAARREAWRLLDLFGLAERADQLAGGLPHGGERLLGIARALASRPDFLLLDEPAAGMNASEGEELVRRIVQIRDQTGCGVLVVEHDMHLIMALSERIHVLDYGKTLAEGDRDVVRADPAVIRAYFGDEEVPDRAAG
ncbi:ABC transporter ATP-binding protein [Conexibacter woesei]|uniref:ABC transporter related protein n=1 Tax=Conexibacter woesei (strain DSM 14684 / CCUG 47730 / CIP 108061 / JCM 11494 / NBRC 100937 / ID131577) TaxID=469383 RepID=D3F6Z6_CONWI|nr:ABC transporter ATP-binding protein [Conexibacter woesei]ADB52794.1 ABC transporter related protein [Conexibacter woesei DSM 14684]